MSKVKYPVIILAGENTGRYRKEEKEEKGILNWIFGEKYLTGNKALKRVSSTGKTILEHEMDAINDSSRISSRYIVGPSRKFSRLKTPGFRVVENQGTLYGNIREGVSELIRKESYRGVILIVSGDLPLISGESIDQLIGDFERVQDEKTKIYYAITPRREIKQYLIENDLSDYKLPTDYLIPLPIPGKLNKFGPVLRDDKGFFEKGKKDFFIAGNAFFLDTSVGGSDIEDISRLVYTFRKGFLYPKNWPFMLKNIGVFKAARLALGLETITAAEDFLSRFPVKTKEGRKTYSIKAVHADSSFALDVDWQLDLERADAYYAGKS